MDSPAPSGLAKELPDLPRWVGARSLLLSGECEVVANGSAGDYVVREAGRRIACVVGQPGAEVIRRAVDGMAEGSILMSSAEAADGVARALPAWRRKRTRLHLLSDGGTSVAPLGAADVRLIDPATIVLDHVPAALRLGIETALRRSPVAVASVDGRAVSFCFASGATESLWNVWIETLRPHRGRGLGSECLRFLTREMRRSDRQPVWGVMESDAPALRITEKLGFEPVDRICVFTPA
jgi:GNAT superfamily N-acetyltransferase